MSKLSPDEKQPIYNPLNDKPPRYEITEDIKRELAFILVSGLRFGKYYVDEIG